MLVKPEATPSGSPGTRRNPPSTDDGKGREQPAGISLPNIIPVTEAEWPKHGFDKFTALKIKDAGDGEQGGADDPNVTRYDFFINVDNLYLKSEMKFAKSDEPLLKARFTYGMVLVGLGLLQQDMTDQPKNGNETTADEKDDFAEDLETRVERVTKALAPIMLPMIEALGGLDLAEVEASAVSGEAT